MILDEILKQKKTSLKILDPHEYNVYSNSYFMSESNKCFIWANFGAYNWDKNNHIQAVESCLAQSACVIYELSEGKS